MGVTIQYIFWRASNIVSYVTPFLMAVAIAIFVYGIVKFISAAGDTEKIKEAKNYIIYGILGLFVLVAFWGLVSILVTTFGLDAESATIVMPPAPFL